MEKIISEIVRVISLYGSAPKPYGVFHIVSLVLTALLTCLLIRAVKNGDENAEKRLFLIFSVILLAGELYKQFVLSLKNGVWDYNLYFFPLQFCSTPMYVYPLTFFTKNKNLYNGAILYSATYCLIAGAVVLAYPGSIFCDSYGINVQSTVHHAVMVAFGLALLVKHIKKFTPKAFTYGAGLFLFFLVSAIIFNTVFGEAVNMYYLNPASPVKVPIISALFTMLPAPVVIIMYAAIYTGLAFIFSGIPFHRKRNRI